MEQDTVAEEVPLEEQVLTVEADVKLLKGAKTPQKKAQLEGLECLLQELRDRQ